MALERFVTRANQGKPYTSPRKYLFIAPQGTGTKLSNLHKKPDALRDADLLTQWDTHCRDQITMGLQLELDHALPQDHICFACNRLAAAVL
jgi:hypothetical protein